ncbi:enoyl-CoA hydratase [Acrasis kona]|uniref:Enoyl-CoA hydratase n=1 Tax=Acrasis kona TaxID=1008807 RepID=A0AAW2ZJP8_9EUKA
MIDFQIQNKKIDQMSEVLTENLGDGVFIIKINRPKLLNSLTTNTLRELAKAFNDLSDKKETRAVILTGEGRAFSAGIDLTSAIKVFQGEFKPTKETDPVLAMNDATYPIIGAINGYAITGGFEIALACDILIGGESAAFQDTHAKFGLMPSWGLSQKLPRLIGANRARHSALTATKIDSKTAYEWGLISRVVPDSELLNTCKQIAKEIVANHPVLVKNYKNVINTGIEMNFKDAMQHEQDKAWSYYGGMVKSDFDKMAQFIASRGQKSKL